MRKSSLILLQLFLVSVYLQGAQSLRLHPQNPHYFEFRGKPTILITSGEHYGAILNRSFDYSRYLETLAENGFNLTRVFSGAYVEPQGAFSIERNTLAPSAGDFLSPWARSDEPGYPNGGNKFDLTRWNPEYFSRLKAFFTSASDRGIVIEMVLFCPFYSDAQWQLSPLNTSNNINGIGQVDRESVYTVNAPASLLEVQYRLVEKLVKELNEFDNLYFEVCNEPYFGGVTKEWHRQIAQKISGIEASLPNRHLISWNYANAGQDDLKNWSGRIDDPDSNISIYNFHYSNPPTVVAMNYHLKKVIGENETGFRGTGDDYYRREAWEFILAGGGLFNHLDYSFAVGFEDGTFQFPETQPGGGSPQLRNQFRILGDFIRRFDFVRMKPMMEILRTEVPEGGRIQILAEAGSQYAIFLRGERWSELVLQVPEGDYSIIWIDPLTGGTIGNATIRSGRSELHLAPPVASTEMALRILRVR